MMEDADREEESREFNASAEVSGTINVESKRYSDGDCVMEDSRIGKENLPMEVEQFGEWNLLNEEGNVLKKVINEIDAKKSTPGNKQDLASHNDNHDDDPMSCDESRHSMESSDDEFSFSSDEEEDALTSPSCEFPSIGKPFDMNLLRNCIARGEESLHLIENKDIVLVVGKTGTGKSTLIQGVAGKAFEKSIYTGSNELGGMTASKDVFNAINPITGFDIGHAKSSMTQYIKCYKWKNDGKIGTKDDKKRSPKSLFYLDTPGFEDTNGEEVDIATSAMLGQVAKKSRSMRVIVMIHYVSLLEDRGGAIRSVLKLMRNLVDDFAKHKQSFMFLFSHADEVKAVADTPEGAKKSLLNEINLTVEATKNDDDAKELLLHIRRCLRKEYPFVDILHPLTTDFSKLSALVEEKMRPIAATSDFVSNVLSGNSKMRLMGATTNLLTSLKVALKKNPVCVEEVKEIQNTFHYFEQYINFEEMRAAVKGCDEEINGHISRLREVIKTEVRNGTTTATETKFGEHNMTLLGDALEQLRVIDSKNFDIQAEREYITRKVFEFQKELVLDKTTNLYNFHVNIQKLKSWSLLDSQYRQFFDAVVENANAYVQQSLAVVSNFHPSQVSISVFSTNEVDEVFSSLKILKSIQENMGRLSKNLSGIVEASNTYDRFVNELKNYLNELIRNLGSSRMKPLDITNPEVLEKLAKEIAVMEELSKLIDRTSLQTDMLALVKDVLESIENQTVDTFMNACEESSLKCRNGDYRSMRNDLDSLQSVKSTLSFCAGGRWREMDQHFNTLVGRVKSILKKKSGELDEMSDHALRHGITDGKRDGKSLANFGKLRWFDVFLPQEDHFVVIWYTKIRNNYFRKLVDAIKVIEKDLQRLSSNAKSQRHHDVMKRTKALPKQIAEVCECCYFGNIIGDEEMEEKSSKLVGQVHEYMGERASYLNTVSNTWSTMVSKRKFEGELLTESTSRLDAAFREISELTKLSSDVGWEVLTSEFHSMDKEMKNILSRYLQKVKRSLESELTYEDLAFLIAQVKALGTFENTAPHLPRLENLKDIARQRIARDAKKIEDMVEETSQFDVIDGLIKEYEKATVLDESISEEVISRLRPLKRLRSEKETEADVVIAEMIEKLDFRGLGAFLTPLAESKNQIRSERFKKSVDRIANSLRLIDDKIKDELCGEINEESGPKIASNLKILDEGNKEIGQHLRKHTFSFKLGPRIKNLKNQVNMKYVTLQNLTRAAIEDADFVAIVKRKQRAAIIERHLGIYLSEKSKRRMKDNSESLLNLKRSIPNDIKTFTDSLFTDSEAISRILRGLKPTTSMDGPIFTDLSQLYAQSTRNLNRQVRNLVQKIRKSTEDAECFDDSIIVIKNLLHSVEHGLKDHLQQNLIDQSERILEEWEEANRVQQSKINFEDIPVDIAMNDLKKILDNSAPASGLWQKLSGIFSNQRSSSTYERHKRTLRETVVQYYRQGCQALNQRDYATLRSTIDFLIVADSIAGEHVDLAGRKLPELNEKAIESFRRICRRCHEILQTESCREFEALFVDFRSFVLHIPGLMENSDAVNSFHLTNQLVHERICEGISSTEAALKRFDFVSIKQKVEDIRRFGGFVADHYSLFHEELKGYSHVKKDKNLDNLKGKISVYFQEGRDLKKIKYYAILGVPPSATKAAMKKAYRKKSLTCHPDKCKDKRYVSEWSDKFRILKDAFDELDSHFISQKDRESQPFDDSIRCLGDSLRDETRTALTEQNYEYIERILFRLQGIEIIENLVKPKLATPKIKSDVVELVQNHVQKVRTEVDSNWSERKYQDLNYNIKDLKMMEEKLSSHPNVFSSSWNSGIIKKVESEIENLGVEARGFLHDKKMANAKRDEFRRCFMRMGAVLVELPEFKDYTKKVMSDILESCLNSNWGYSYVFDLGLSLQKGGDIEGERDESEARIAYNLVNEFQHFKEVLTMVWNEETIQKPPENTIQGIRGRCHGNRSMNMNSEYLLKQYNAFDAAYSSFLGEYLSPEADIKALVRKVISTCNSLKPVSCDDGFGDKTKNELPSILAGIFAIFTILKSGESYNRLDQDTSDCTIDAKKLLMKPHNIQVLTLLCMFGCGTSKSASLKSQLLQIRTGEGKSMILGAAASVFGLLGFRVRCVCYSEYLSSRDYELFRDVFEHFELSSLITYSKITSLSEDTTTAKGDIRGLTLSLVRDALPQKTGRKDGNNCKKSSSRNSIDITPMDIDERSNTVSRRTRSKKRNVKREPDLTESKALTRMVDNTVAEEIMLVDEVDVFFGSEFYGQTYNQVAQLKEPEVATILRTVWENYKKGMKRQRLANIKLLAAYKNLIAKFPGYDYLLDNEIALMLDQVRRVDDEPFYHLDRGTGMIGYKVQDTISYNVTYGYRTIFAYLKEADSGNLKNHNETLSQVLTMPISCGQFSYANIKPKRILGVSGTLEVMSKYEKSVLQKYGVSQYLFIPSVYGNSNFSFDKAGDGVSIEKGIGDFFHRITKEITEIATQKRRAVIVFFSDTKRLKEYTSSPFYRKLGRKKETLTESMTTNEKSFVICKAATTGQITLCTSIFGRGTDFFCKDDLLENNGGVHVIQTFLSADMSEEIQIQGRTARQGKQGSYRLILLDQDLENNFGIEVGSSDTWPRTQLYEKLCEARKKVLEEKHALMDANLLEANQQDVATHEYFDALLDSNATRGKDLLKDLYLKMKKAHVAQMDLDLAFAIDITGSMIAYGNTVYSIMQSLLEGPNSILKKLDREFPDTEFKLKVAVLGFRDIADGQRRQFVEMSLDLASHFSNDMNSVLRYVKDMVVSCSGGGDVAEDHLGAIHRCLDWNSTGDWEGSIKALLLLTDAPTHGYAPTNTMVQNIDAHSGEHPSGLTIESTVNELVAKDVDLFVCSFDPNATARFEAAMEKQYTKHPSGRELTTIPLVSKSLVPHNTGRNPSSDTSGDAQKHNIFVLDESGSMHNDWSGVVSVLNKFVQNRLHRQQESDLVSIVQFANSARTTCRLENIINAPKDLGYGGGGTNFGPAAMEACNIARATPPTHKPVVIFMSDGCANDSQVAANCFSALDDVELHVIGFGGGTDTAQLQDIARSSPNGRVHTASDIDNLSKIFVEIAGGGDAVASVLETEIGKRIAEAVTERLSAEYLG